MSVDRSKIVVGSQVAFNHLDDAVWFDVLDVDVHKCLTVRQCGYPDEQKQYIDICYVAQVQTPKEKQ